jgi:hypothetical protein
VQWSASEADYHQTCRGTNGYAYDLRAVVRLDDSSIAVDWKLANTGSKTFSTKQYTHNFVRMGDNNVGPDYVLEFPYDFHAKGLETEQRQEGRKIRFVAEIPKWINAVVEWPQTYRGPNVCMVRQTATGQSIRFETSIPGFQTAIHARSGFVSPEQFVSITLKPGETKCWTRTWELGKNLPTSHESVGG